MIAYNGKRSWMETHHEVVAAITAIICYDTPGQVTEDLEQHGSTVLYDIAEKLTDLFESRNLGRFWDGDFIEEVEQWVQDYNNGKINLYPNKELNQSVIK